MNECMHIAMYNFFKIVFFNTRTSNTFDIVLQIHELSNRFHNNKVLYLFR